MKRTPLKRTSFKRKKAKPKSKLQKRKDNVGSTYWRDRADVVWSAAVKKRDDYECQICATRNNLNSHHLIPKGQIYYRHELENGLTLCSLHHNHSNELSAHGSPAAFGEWMRENRPEQWAWVIERVHKIHHQCKPNYKARLEGLLP